MLCDGIPTDTGTIPNWVEVSDEACPGSHPWGRLLGFRREFTYSGRDGARIGTKGIVEVLGVDDRCYSICGKTHSQTDTKNHQRTPAACPSRSCYEASGEATVHTWEQSEQEWEWKDRCFGERKLFIDPGDTDAEDKGRTLERTPDQRPTSAALVVAPPAASEGAGAGTRTYRQPLDWSIDPSDDAPPNDPTEGTITHEIGPWVRNSVYTCTPPPCGQGGRVCRPVSGDACGGCSSGDDRFNDGDRDGRRDNYENPRGYTTSNSQWDNMDNRISEDWETSDGNGVG